jgi:hypothetical protein
MLTVLVAVGAVEAQAREHVGGLAGDRTRLIGHVRKMSERNHALAADSRYLPCTSGDSAVEGDRKMRTRVVLARLASLSAVYVVAAYMARKHDPFADVGEVAAYLMTLIAIAAGVCLALVLSTRSSKSDGRRKVRPWP